jgi:plasmid stabilization system protein ParE
VFPERGRIMPELGLDDIREVFVFNFRVVYQLADAEIRIVAILHGARDLRGWRPTRPG